MKSLESMGPGVPKYRVFGVSIVVIVVMVLGIYSVIGYLDP